MKKVKSKYFEPVKMGIGFPTREDELVSFWKKNKIFEKSIEKNPKNKTWNFLDGPPFITGLPHYGTLLSSIPKDLFCRFWSMKGYRVPRAWGWDGHGLPIENKVEKKLGVKRKRDIEESVGIGKFISECKKYVGEVSSEWEWYVDHIGRWVDFKNAYKTWNTSYMESVMWVFKSMYDKGYVYKGLRVSLYCPHCSTPISNFEVAMDSDNYKELSEESTYYKFKVKGEENRYILAWSTTPWNKIVTTALAINPKLTYVEVEENGEKLILAKLNLKVLKSKKPKIVKTYKAKELEGLKYEPFYNFFKIAKDKSAYEVVLADFVTADEGTGVVTIAPYGEEDLYLMQKNNIHIELHVDDEGHFKNYVPNWAGMYYLKADKLIDEALDKKGNVYKKEKVTHTIPTCWRCHTRLFYNPQNAWYVDIQKLKPKLFKNNEKVNWYPNHFKMGRFRKSMEAAPDWCISRSRYWGSPVPVWECNCGERFVPGSIDELEEASGVKVGDLHKPEIDEVSIKCKRCGKEAKRVPEVLDSWIEAGSASFAERHFPFEKNVKLEDFFPPDFIVEYTGQIRAWFYVLHVLATALYDSNAFKNVLVTGVILGTDGRKMSKNFGNYPDPKEMLKKHGGDALRLYLMSTPVMKGEDTVISEDSYKDWVRNYLLTFFNTYNYFVTYANLDNWEPTGTLKTPESENVLDTWILLRLNEVIKKTSKALENYDTINYAEILKKFVVDLSTWYLRRSRERQDRNTFYSTIYFILVTFSKVSAPMTPFVSEIVYKNLTKEESVHLTEWPHPVKVSRGKPADIELLSQMKTVREIVEQGHSLRKEARIPVRQPLAEFKIKNLKLKIEGLEKLILDELNIKKITWGSKRNELDKKISPALLEEAKTRELARKIQEQRKNMGVNLDQEIEVVSDWLPVDRELLDWLKTKTIAKSFKKGGFSVKKI